MEMLPGLLPMMDADLGKELQRAYSRRGIKIMTSARALPDSVKSGDDAVELTVEVDGAAADAAGGLSSAGGRSGGRYRRSRAGNHGCRNRSRLYQDRRESANAVANVYAVGDVAGGLGLAHKAYAEGILAAESIAGKNHLKTIDTNRVPQPVFCFPQVAAVGMTEAKAREDGAEVEVGKFPFTANAKAKILEEAAGFVKMVADKRTGDVLGVHMIGPNVTELISEAALGKFLESTPWEMAYNIHPHPTLSEALGEAAHATEGEGPIHA